MTPVWFTFLGCSLATLAGAGNGLVILFIATKQHLRTKPNWFIMSLSLARLAGGVTFFPLLLFCDAQALCLNSGVLPFILWFSIASSFNLSAIAGERYVAAAKAELYDQVLTNKRVAVVLVLTWALSSVPPIVVFAILPETGEDQSVLLCPMVVKALSSLVSVALIVSILCATRNRSRRVMVAVAQENSNGQEEGEPTVTINMPPRRKSSVTPLAVLVVLDVVSTVFVVVITCCVKMELCSLWLSLRYGLKLFHAANTALNPLVLALSRGDINNELKQWLGAPIQDNQ